MRFNRVIKSTIISAVLLFASLYTNQVSGQMTASHTDEVKTIQLVQVEGEYVTTELTIAPGKYIFEVTNQEVDKGLGFWLTPTNDEESQVPNSGLEKLVEKGEKSQTGVVTLTTGTFQYSCPLNPTPHYTITVTE